MSRRFWKVFMERET